MTEPSAACGGYSEAEEAQNKEDHKQQRREPTMFWVGSRRFESCHLDQQKNPRSLGNKGFSGLFVFERGRLGAYLGLIVLKNTRNHGF